MTENRTMRLGAAALLALVALAFALATLGRAPDPAPRRDAYHTPLAELEGRALAEHGALADRPLVGFLASRELRRAERQLAQALGAGARLRAKPGDASLEREYRMELDLLADQDRTTAELTRLLFWFLAAALALIALAVAFALLDRVLVAYAVLVFAVLPALFPAALASPAGILVAVLIPIAATTVLVCDALKPGPAGPLVRGLEEKLARAGAAARAKVLTVELVAGVLLVVIAAGVVGLGIALHGGVIVVGTGVIIVGFMRIGRAIAVAARSGRRAIRYSGSRPL
jgi:hypothetical protein